MKRSVAIRGATPMFVRWAIERQCPLREIHMERLPETTFRQLRAIRELSLSHQQGRFRAGYVLHPKNKADAPGEALGFSIDEVAGLFGGMEAIKSSCEGCSANTGAELRNGFWAGCFGLVSSDLRWNLDNIIRGEFVKGESVYSANHVSLAATEFDLAQIINRTSPPVNQDDPTKRSEAELPLWVRLWQERVPSGGQLLLLEETVQKTLELLSFKFTSVTESTAIGSDCLSRPDGVLASDSSRAVGVHASACCDPSAPRTDRTAKTKTVIDSNITRDLQQFLHAVRRCREYELPLHVELIPAGYSDGLTWRLFAHCQNCKQTWPEPSQPCSICGPSGSYQNEIKLKVLGLRPYLRLADMIGLDETKRILTGLRNH